MSVTVPTDVEAKVREMVESGRFETEADVVREALKLLDAREQRFLALRASIDEGLAAIDRGEGVELTPELMDEIEREAAEMVRLGRQPKLDVCP